MNNGPFVDLMQSINNYDGDVFVLGRKCLVAFCGTKEVMPEHVALLMAVASNRRLVYKRPNRRFEFHKR